VSFPTVRISLDEKDFTDLVAGKVVARQGRDQDGTLVRVKVALQDIGFDRIRAIADEAEWVIPKAER